MEDEKKNPPPPHCYLLVVTCVVFRYHPRHGLQALLLKRSLCEKEGPGLWTVPGGKVDKKDHGVPLPGLSHTLFLGSLERAMAREILEETGIVLSEEEFTPLKNRNTVFIRQDGTPTMVLTYVAFCRSDVPVILDDGAVEYAWVLFEDLGKYHCIGNVKDDVIAAMREHMHKDGVG